MGKHYDIDFKNKILNEYLKGQGGSIYLGKKYIPIYDRTFFNSNAEKKKVELYSTFSRHDRVSKLPLFVWLNENVVSDTQIGFHPDALGL